MTCHRICGGDAPSIIAASSSSRGILIKYCRSRNTLNAFAKKCGTMSGSQAEINIGALMGRRLRLIGSVLRPRSLAEKVEIKEKSKKKIRRAKLTYLKIKK